MQATLQRAGGRTVTLLRDALYPPTCLMCDARVQEVGGLCPDCWRETPFLSGATCDLCGTDLPGEGKGPMHCDDCLREGRPWAEGRAALRYGGLARRFVLSLKHGDRTELARGAAAWMHRRARDVLTPETLLLPVPIHRWRLLKRRYNQSALLAQELARLSGCPWDPLALTRTRHTPPQDSRSASGRHLNVAGSISVARPEAIRGRHVALVDDVMTSGATLTACAEALAPAQPSRISVLLLARVAKDR
ncbi:ComF family protein [Jannaschia marina]|uniref:ComF family protein n=1 Tax=Jannaschia marina TaxID=2741674 RepID=UPI0015C8135D|nr:ComF family protein [Jannaschia marina]